VDHVINLLELEFVKEPLNTKTRRMKLDYLGMFLDFSIPGMVEISMKEYVKEIVSKAQGDMKDLCQCRPEINCSKLTQPGLHY